ncbi:protein kinase domain-containing protein [Pseudoteredinibacter isoporae]|uniref:Serine/threonine protein kinase n=1 Tax=Pseudoteredinibacter isoporae TaxID=570281 RepID=A0A7X0JSP1_9GAMM|nr:serine/threonine protein kinase [Pseudoteredinibacter isoporae]NHO87098.1 protein kinase [Pseudoteredinibacter isoporae]NIB22922.1 protein kinase [Pseudoteredinibacter isoporae]
MSKKKQPLTGGDVLPGSGKSLRDAGNAESDDKTVIQSVARPSAQNSQQKPEDDSSDKTQFASTSAPQAVTPDDGSDKTVLLGSAEIDDPKASDKTQFIHPADTGDDRTVMLGGSVNATELLHDSATQLQGENVTVAGALSPEQLQTGQLDEEGRTVIKDRFVLESLLGSGGMGAVYKAKDLRKVEAKDRDPWVAVKVLNENFKNHPSAFISLQREARKSQTLAHPNIVQVFDFDRDGDMVYMTMELLSGASLEEVIKLNPEGLPLEQILPLTRQMGEALAHAHRHRITHADFKPGNVFLCDGDVAKVIDFGIARAVSSVETDQRDDKTVFDPNSLGALTPAYASLEMLLGEEPLPSCDVYALGCIVYELLSGKHPFGKKPADQVAIERMKPKRLPQLNRRQWKALRRSLALKRVNRFTTVDEFLNEFVPIVNPWRRPVALAAVAASLLLAFAGYRAYQSQEKEKQLEIEKQALAARQAEQQREMATQRQVQEFGTKLSSDFGTLTEEAGELQELLDQRNLSFDTGALWQRQTAVIMDELLEVYESDEWKVDAGKHPLAARDDFQQMLNDQDLKRQQAKQTLANWARTYNFTLSDAYLAGAIDAADENRFSEAQRLSQRARELNPNSVQLSQVDGHIERQISAYQAEQERLAQAREAARLAAERQRLRDAFEVEVASLRETVQQCQSGLLREGRGGVFKLDLERLAGEFTRVANRYPVFQNEIQQLQQNSMSDISSCIRVYGYGKTQDAKDKALLASQLFPTSAVLFESMEIYPWNSCKTSFAGRGQRYSCRDRFLENDEFRGPELLVIPNSPGEQAYAISKYEISESEFNDFCAQSQLCSPSSNSGNIPVTGRSIDLFRSYAQWLSSETGFEYQLPSYKQWYKAAAANQSPLDSGRNCTLNSRGIRKGDSLLPVDMGAGNRWGMVNHVGNAQEVVLHPDGLRAAGGSHAVAMESCNLDSLNPISTGGDARSGFRVVKLLP